MHYLPLLARVVPISLSDNEASAAFYNRGAADAETSGLTN